MLNNPTVLRKRRHETVQTHGERRSLGKVRAVHLGMMHVCLCLSTAQKAAHFGNFTRTTSILNVEFLSLGSLQLPAVKTAQVFLHLCTIDTDE